MQPRREPLDRIRIRTLLRSEHASGLLEGGAHVAEHDEPRALNAAGALDRLDRPGATVGGGAAADAEIDGPGSVGKRGRDELAGAGGARGNGVALGLSDEAQAAGGGGVHERDVPRQAELGLDRAAQRVGDRGLPALGAQPGGERVQRALAAVSDGAEIRRAPGGVAGRDRLRPPPRWR